MNYASQEKNRVAELKMKAAELTQIIEEGNLAHSSTKGSATMVRRRHDQANEQGVHHENRVPSIPRSGNSNMKSWNENSEIVQ